MLNTILGSFSTGVAPVTSSYESIATTTVGAGGAASIEFTSIPSTYTHLQIRGIGTCTRNIGTMDLNITFNSDTGANYSRHQLKGDGASATAAGSANLSDMQMNSPIPNSTNTSIYAGLVLDILDYTNTNKYKTMRILVGSDLNGSGQIIFGSGNWRNTNAVTSVKFTPETFNWAQYSHFALYGIKGA